MIMAPAFLHMWLKRAEVSSPQDLIGGMACAAPIGEKKGVDRGWTHALQLPADALAPLDMEPVGEDHQVPFPTPRLERASRQPVVAVCDRFDQPVFLHDRRGGAREGLFEDEEVARGDRHRLIRRSRLSVDPDRLEVDPALRAPQERSVRVEREVPVVGPGQLLLERVEVGSTVGKPIDRGLAAVVSRLQSECRRSSPRQLSNHLVCAPEVVRGASPLPEHHDRGGLNIADFARGDPHAVTSERGGHEEEPKQHGIYLSLNGSLGIR